jgi:hypothetical protein
MHEDDRAAEFYHFSNYLDSHLVEYLERLRDARHVYFFLVNVHLDLRTLFVGFNRVREHEETFNTVLLYHDIGSSRGDSHHN